MSEDELSATETELMRALSGQRLQYAQANQPERAHGVGKAMAIVLRWMTQPDARLDDPIDTIPADL
jgi:hypothetical protein